MRRHAQVVRRWLSGHQLRPIVWRMMLWLPCWLPQPPRRSVFLLSPLMSQRLCYLTLPLPLLLLLVLVLVLLLRPASNFLTVLYDPSVHFQEISLLYP